MSNYTAFIGSGVPVVTLHQADRPSIGSSIVILPGL